MQAETFAQVVARAGLAPSIHNAQPTRWHIEADQIILAADLSIALPQADPDGQGISLSCGAALEATVLSLSELGYSAHVEDLWAQDDRHSWPGHRMVARLSFSTGATADRLAAQLENRFTWRGLFAAQAPRLYGWTRDDTALVLDRPTIDWIGELNDQASLPILRRKAFRQELLDWMRLSPDHPRSGRDGMALDALGLTPRAARQVAWGLGPLWPALNLMGRAAGFVSDAHVTRSAPLIACFHRPQDESPLVTGRAYLRLWLEATALGFAGCPMAALTDDPTAAAAIIGQLSIPPERRLVQVIRFGRATGMQPARARRPLTEVIS